MQKMLSNKLLLKKKKKFNNLVMKKTLNLSNSKKWKCSLKKTKILLKSLKMNFRKIIKMPKLQLLLICKIK